MSETLDKLQLDAVKLRGYQCDAVAAVWQSIRNGNNPIVCMPTGSGKSHVIAQLIEDAVGWQGRVLVCAHRKELLLQNGSKIDISHGFYSAGLGETDTESNVIFAGIQSAYSHGHEFGERHLLIVDECHLIPPDGEGMYRQLIADMREANPKLSEVGLSATPYRMKTGCLTDGDIFDEICYDAPLQKLMDDGHLCQLKNTAAKSQIDSSRIEKRSGEFVAKSMEGVYLQGDNVSLAVNEILEKTADRKSVLIFCSGVAHAERVHEKIGEAFSDVITGETPPLFRSRIIEDFKNGILKYLINVDVLTTGFDAPNIDCICVLRSTMSPGLFAQIVGRGLRTSEGKQDCLVLDFGENIKRHGPLNDPMYGKRPKREIEQGGDAPVKICPECQAENHCAVAFCCQCGFAFPSNEKHDAEADEESQIIAEPTWHQVEKIDMYVWVKRGTDSQTMRVDYSMDGDIAKPIASEWICLEHTGFARSKAVAWWQDHSVLICPTDVCEGIDLWKRGALRTPCEIQIVKKGGFEEIVNRKFEGERPTHELCTLEESEKWDEEEIPF